MFVKSSMKVLYRLLSIITLLSLSVEAQLPQFPVPNRPLVRLIYLVPVGQSIDRGSFPIIGQGWDERIRNLAVKTQSHYEQEMRRHGFVDANGDGKTFLLEKNEGDIVVHQINGQYTVQEYQNSYALHNVDRELFFDTNAPFRGEKEHIYLIFIETDKNYLQTTAHVCGIGKALYHQSGPPPYTHNAPNAPMGLFSIATVPLNKKCIRDGIADTHDTVIPHELGHAFGLQHDYRNDEYIMSYGSAFSVGGVVLSEDYGTKLSTCAAEWLNHHRAFNDAQGDLNSNTTFVNNTQNPREIVVEDPDGVGSVQLIRHDVPKVGNISLVDCHSSNNRTIKNIVERVDPTAFSATINGQNINITMSSDIRLQAIDKHGNITRLDTTLDDLLALKAVVLYPKGGLTEATLTGGTVSLELTGPTYTPDLSKIKSAVTVEGIKGVTINPVRVQRRSDRKVRVTLDFDGTDFDTDATLTFRVDASAIDRYYGGELTAKVPVTAHQEKLTATPTSPLTEENLNESVVTGDVLTAKVPVTASGEESLLKMYWIIGDSPDYPAAIQRTNFNGMEENKNFNERLSDVETLVEPTPYVTLQGIALDVEGGKMYWTRYVLLRAAEIQRANLDGSDVETLVVIPTRGSKLQGIALDVEGGKMYWTRDIPFGDGKIQRANLDGSNIEDLVTLWNPQGIALDVEGGKMYWTNHDKIRRANLDGSNIEDLVTQEWPPYPWNIALDVEEGKMYWTEWGGINRRIRRANLDGSNIEDLVALWNPQGIALDVEGGKMYWAERGGINVNSRIRRANLDGSNIEDFTLAIYGVLRNIAIDILSPAQPPAQPVRVKEDVNSDGHVDVDDLVYVAQQYGQTGTNSADVNGDKVVNVDDFILVAAVVDAAVAAAPAARVHVQSHFTASQLDQWLTEARASGNTSDPYQRGIAVVEQLLALTVPEETSLLANYPNPFNPETWIPYQLATPADVTLTIYDIEGRVVRDLDIGHQRAGMYHTRSRAAYWDGRNAQGEPVASGVYFYTLTAGDFSATRKLLIRK